MKNILCFLLFCSCLFGIELKNLYEPQQLLIRDDKLYACDRYCLKIFNLSTGKLIKEIGRKGEGPQEFRSLPNIFINKNELFISSMGKIGKYSLRGKLKEEIITNSSKVHGKIRYYYLGSSLVAQKKTLYLQYNILDKNFIKLKNLVSHIIKKKKYVLFTSVIHESLFSDGDNFIYVDLGLDKISVFDNSLKKINTIHIKSIKRPFVRLDKEQIYKQWKEWDDEWRIRVTDIPSKYPTLYCMRFSNKKIYVFTWNIKNGKRECIIYDLQGKVIKCLYIDLKMDNLFDIPIFDIYKGKLYQLKEKEDGCEIYSQIIG